MYYYAAFSADDRDNWSAPAVSAQWQLSTTKDEIVIMNDSYPIKIYTDQHGGQIFVLRDGNAYDLLGRIIK